MGQWACTPKPKPKPELVRSDIITTHAGNLLFVMSFQWRSLAALLAARLLNGCGSARTANRRYTADYVSRAQRTMASAGENWCKGRA